MLDNLLDGLDRKSRIALVQTRRSIRYYGLFAAIGCSATLDYMMMGGGTTVDKRMSMLRSTLEVLASPAAAQIEYLRSITPSELEGSVVIDELALEFDDVYKGVETFRNDEIALFRCLDQLDACFALMSNKQHRSEWAESALKDSPLWDQIRCLARGCLSAMTILDKPH